MAGTIARLNLDQGTLTDTGLFLARSMVGVVGIYHGGQKLFGLFGGGGLSVTAEAMGRWGCLSR